MAFRSCNLLFRLLAVYLMSSLFGDCVRVYDIRRLIGASRGETGTTAATGSCDVGPRDAGDFSYSPGPGNCREEDSE